MSEYQREFNNGRDYFIYRGRLLKLGLYLVSETDSSLPENNTERVAALILSKDEYDEIYEEVGSRLENDRLVINALSRYGVLCDLTDTAELSDYVDEVRSGHFMAHPNVRKAQSIHEAVPAALVAWHRSPMYKATKHRPPTLEEIFPLDNDTAAETDVA